MTTNNSNGELLGPVYLCGPITGLSYGESTDWRKYCQEKYPNVRWLSPMRGKSYLKDTPVIKDHHKEYILSTIEAIVCRDSNDVRNCKAILANFLGAEKPSIGSLLEIGMAYALNKPIIVINNEDNPHWHGMVRRMSSITVDNLDNGLYLIDQILSSGV